jgi:hypothetical protein
MILCAMLHTVSFVHVVVFKIYTNQRLSWNYMRQYMKCGIVASCVTVQFCNRLPTFLRYLLPPSGWKWSTYSQHILM